MNLKRIGVNILATLFCWLTVVVVQALVKDEAFVLDLVILGAFGATIALWLTWAFTFLGEKDPKSDEKQKRIAAQDDRLALLLELMDDRERKVVRQRLLDQLGADGERTSLDQLLALDPQGNTDENSVSARRT